LGFASHGVRFESMAAPTQIGMLGQAVMPCGTTGPLPFDVRLSGGTPGDLAVLALNLGGAGFLCPPVPFGGGELLIAPGGPVPPLPAIVVNPMGEATHTFALAGGGLLGQDLFFQYFSIDPATLAITPSNALALSVSRP
jgi:hypothetical protein